MGARSGVPPWLRKRLSLLFWIASSSILFVVCCRVLWRAYAHHVIFMPLRRGGRSVILEQEPGFFWAAIVVYAVVVLCAPFAVVMWTGEFVGHVRARRQRLQRSRS